MYRHAWSHIAANDLPWDVVVLGAGPAGSTAARQLARQGHRVLLVDKARLPRAKVCGGCLGGVALDLLVAIGLGDLPLRCGGVALRRMHLASGGVLADIPVGRRIAVSRETFDDALVQEAIEAGVIVCDATHGSFQHDTLPSADDAHFRRVTLRRDGMSIEARARAVLVATGLSPSPAGYATDRWSRSRVGLGTLLDLPPGEPPSDALRMACNEHGYVGIAAVDGRRIDVAAAVDPQALAAARSPGELVSNILRTAGLPPVGGLQAAAWRGTPLLTQQTRPLGGHRCLLIGDAAGYVEPFTGQGIGWAMQSAVAASQLIADHLDAWDDSVAARWQRVYDATLLRSHRRCSAITQLLRIEPVRQLAVWSLRQAPGLARPVVRQLDRTKTLVFSLGTVYSDRRSVIPRYSEESSRTPRSTSG